MRCAGWPLLCSPCSSGALYDPPAASTLTGWLGLPPWRAVLGSLAFKVTRARGAVPAGRDDHGPPSSGNDAEGPNRPYSTVWAELTCAFLWPPRKGRSKRPGFLID